MNVCSFFQSSLSFLKVWRSEGTFRISLISMSLDPSIPNDGLLGLEKQQRKGPLGGSLEGSVSVWAFSVTTDLEEICLLTVPTSSPSRGNDRLKTSHACPDAKHALQHESALCQGEGHAATYVGIILYFMSQQRCSPGFQTGEGSSQIHFFFFFLSLALPS